MPDQKSFCFAFLSSYKIILVIPDKMSREKILHLEGLGAEIILTRSDVPEGHPEYYHDVARKVASETPGSFHRMLGATGTFLILATQSIWPSFSRSNKLLS